MGKPFAKSSVLHRSERREREERWANKSEETRNPAKMPDLSPSKYDDQARRHDEAKEYYRDLKKHGYERPAEPPKDWDNRRSREEIDRHFDRPKHIQEVAESKEDISFTDDLRLDSAPTLKFSSVSDFASSYWSVCEHLGKEMKEREERLQQENDDSFENSSDKCLVM